MADACGLLRQASACSGVKPSGRHPALLTGHEQSQRVCGHFHSLPVDASRLSLHHHRRESFSSPCMPTRLENFESSVLKKKFNLKVGRTHSEIQKEQFSVRFLTLIITHHPYPFRAHPFLSSFLRLHLCLILKTWASLLVNTIHLSGTIAN